MNQPDASLVPLTRGYRVPAPVLDLANRLLPALGTTVSPATSLRAGRDSLHVVATDDLVATCVERLTALQELEGSIGVIATADQLKTLATALRRTHLAADSVEHGMESRVTLVPVTLCKGLEFDHVVVVEPAALAELPRGLNWLYVALTRAVTTLTVVHRAPLPQQLADQ
jgi:DNA helicase IV